MTNINWKDSVDNNYAYLRVEHRPFFTPDEVGNPSLEPIGVGYTTNAQPQSVDKSLVATWRDQLTNFGRFYRYGYLKAVRYKIEWCGTYTEAQGHSAIDFGWNESNPANVQGQASGQNVSLQFHKPYVNIMFSRVHEEFDYHRNQNGQQQLEPFQNLGWGQPTRLIYPDIMNSHMFVTGGQNGSMAWRQLANNIAIKKIRFTPSRNTRWVRWTPKSRADKIYTKYDLQKMLQQTATPALAAYDMDMRCGALWMAQERPLTGPFLQGHTVDTSLTMNDLFRITVYSDWMFYGRMANYSTPLVA